MAVRQGLTPAIVVFMSEQQWVEVPTSEIPKDTLVELVQSFVLREGTDYGSQEASMESKIKAVMTQLERGTSLVVFDVETESCTILTKQEFKLRQNEHKRLDQTR